MTSAQLATLQWLANGDTDPCSEAIAYYLAFGIRKNTARPPVTKDEIAHCHQLLQEVPEMQYHLPLLSSLSNDWQHIEGQLLGARRIE